jgi:hypothetical protein
MEKIKNGDPVIYKDRKGTIYGRPRENKYKGLLYTVKIGDDEYVKATESEISLNTEELEHSNSHASSTHLTDLFSNHRL